VGGYAFEVFGVKVGVRVTDRSVLPALPDLFPPGWELSQDPWVTAMYSLIVGGEGSRPGTRRLHVLYSSVGRLARTHDLDEALAVLKKDMMMTVGAVAKRQLLIHAGVVGIRGRALVIPGFSHSGKSSLVAALIAQGAVCLSDEYAMIDRQGRVRALRRPLNIRDESGMHATPREPEELGGLWADRPLPMGMVLLTTYKPGATFRPKTLTPARGILEVFAHTLTAVWWPRRALSWLVQLLQGVPILKGARGEARDAARDLMEARDERQATEQADEGAGRPHAGGRDPRVRPGSRSGAGAQRHRGPGVLALRR
jgi:hypothetical protein